MKTIAQINKVLAEGKERVGISERFVGPVRKLGPAAESMDGGETDPGTQYEAKIWHADRINSNNRVYPRELMQRNIDRLRPKFAEGGVCGSVDHGTGLAQQAIIWRDMRMEADGAAYGKFEIVGTSVGKDLEVQCRSGMSVGMSTFGWGTGRKPTDAERTKYNLPAENDEEYDEDGNYYGPVIMDDDYELAKVDAVDVPSVPDARLVQKQSREGGNVATEETNIAPVAEAKKAACDSGLHWIQRGTCGHVIGECTCETDEKHTIWADHQCEKCGGVRDGMTVSQFKQCIAESKPHRNFVSEAKQEPLAKTYHKYVKGKGGDSFEPVGNIATAYELSSNAFEIIPTWGGVRFVRKPVQTDELYHFEGSPMASVLKEIDDFWNAKPEYEKYGVMFHRGIIMHGAPGTGKTSAVNQAVEMVTGRGDVVFYGRNIGVLKEGLAAFREVEPTRKVVVVLEDADEYVGYQEREMLNLLDGADTIQDVLYLGTTNYLQRFPERLLRPGRFDKRVHIGPPNLAGRKAYLQNKLGKVEAAEEIDRLAKDTDGLSFGHLRELITAVYALKESKSEVLARLKGTISKSSRLDNRMAIENRNQPTQENSGGTIHLNHACVAKAMAAARSGKIDHGSFDGGATERTAANSDKFLATDTAYTPDEKGHYKFPIFTGDKVSAKGVGTAGHYSEGTYPEIHSATVKISDAIKEHGGDKSAKGDSKNVVPSIEAKQESKDMEKQIVDQLNALFKSVSTVEGFEAPHREVLPAEIAAQLEAKDKQIADLASEVEKVKTEKAALQAKVDAAEAEKSESKRLADVLAKANELLKDSAFSDSLLDDVKDAAADKSFDAAKVEGLIKTRTARYEKAAGPRTTLPTGTSGVHLSDADIVDDLTPEEQAESEQAEESVKPAEELKFFETRKK